ncbi:MAG: hypothetical protein AVDCRST_MAG53-1829, partial [uncultured Solirubrobacteraceae bacterium]
RPAGLRRRGRGAPDAGRRPRPDRRRRAPRPPPLARGGSRRGRRLRWGSHAAAHGPAPKGRDV